MFAKYGLPWHDGVTEVDIELWCYRNNHVPKNGGLGKAEHMKRAIKLLWPERMPNGKTGYVWSEWTDRRVEAWCNNQFHEGDSDWQTWWGPSSSGKSTDAGIIALVHWLSAPDETIILVCSTTTPMLEKRIWGEILRFYNMHGGALPGRYFKSKHAIVLGDENAKAGIHGIAVQKGSVEEALGNLIGMHLRYNALIVDELQAMREVAVDATDNLDSGEEFKFLGMGNPVSRLDPLGRYSEPIVGWDKINPDDFDSWETQYGKTLFFDGRKSPGVRDPKRYFFLITQRQIDRVAKRRGRNSPAFWSQKIGFVPPEGLLQTVMTETMITQFDMMGEPQWEFGYQMVAGLDPAFSSGGDRCILVPAQVGKCTDGITRINFLTPITIHLEVSKKKYMAYHIQAKVQEHCEALGILPASIAMDTTGSQSVLADVIEKEWGPGLLRVSFGGSASEMAVSQTDPTPAREKYANRVTELWFNAAEFGRSNQIRGMQFDGIREFCQRIFDEITFRKTSVETKRKMKSRTGQSPDVADAHACVIAYVRERLGIHPGGDLSLNNREESEYYRKLDIDARADYSTDSVAEVAYDQAETPKLSSSRRIPLQRSRHWHAYPSAA